MQQFLLNLDGYVLKEEHEVEKIAFGTPET
jgi:hypothetical protein